MKIIVILLGLISVKDCNSNKDINQANTMLSDSNITLNGTYVISQLLNEDITEYNLELTFNPEEQKVNGFSGCNRFFGTYSYHENRLNFGVLGATKMFCNDIKNKLESTLFESLSKIDHLTSNDSIIELRSNNQVALTMTKKQEQANVTFEYSALSRGSYTHISINKKEVSVIHKRDSKPAVQPCSESDWNILIEALKPVTIENLEHLEAPSQKRLYDGAAIANLTILYNGTAYKSASFDHGNPPKEIEILVKEILSVSENID
ncbi:META domain-containing protein [Yeosuana sp. AK3]